MERRPAKKPVRPASTGGDSLEMSPISRLVRVRFAIKVESRNVSATGNDDELHLPAHTILTVQNGIFIIENLNLDELAAAKAHEFVFVCLPLKMRGATGSPVRPIALVPRQTRS